MVQEPGEALGARGGLGRRAGRDGPRDHLELTFDRDRQPSGPLADRAIELGDGEIQSFERRERRFAPLAVLPQRDDRAHAAMMRPASDTDREPAQATRTEFTGASRSCTENQEAPPSPEPNTSPEVAPK